MTSILERASESPAESTTSVTLSLSATATAEELDTLWRTKVKASHAAVRLTIDLGPAIFIELTALFFINSLACSPRTQALRVVLPNDARALDFLKVWRFIESLESASRKFRGEFLSPKDIERYHFEPYFFKDRTSPLDYLQFNTNWKVSSSERRNFFEITSLHPNGNSAASIAKKEAERWISPAIIKVLDRHLDGRHLADSVSKVVVYEAISNAVRHPDASVVQIGSSFNYGNKVKALESTFNIYIWDDGKSIASTLQEVIDQGGEIQSKGLPDYMYDQIRVDVADVDKKKVNEPTVIRQDQPIGKHGPSEARLLLASTFPEVSRRHFSENRGEYDVTQGAGMGLYALTRTVLDQYQGKLFMRSGRMHLHLEHAHDAWRKQFNARYKCKIRRHPEHARFRGNLLRISIPITRKAAQ